MQRQNISRVILGMTSATIVGVVLTAPTSNSEFQGSHSGRATATTGHWAQEVQQKAETPRVIPKKRAPMPTSSPTPTEEASQPPVQESAGEPQPEPSLSVSAQPSATSDQGDSSE